MGNKKKLINWKRNQRHLDLENDSPGKWQNKILTGCKHTVLVGCCKKDKHDNCPLHANNSFIIIETTAVCYLVVYLASNKIFARSRFLKIYLLDLVIILLALANTNNKVQNLFIFSSGFLKNP